MRPILRKSLVQKNGNLAQRSTKQGIFPLKAELTAKDVCFGKFASDVMKMSYHMDGNVSSVLKNN